MRKIVLCFMAILVLFVGCGKKESKEATTEGKEVKTIGIAMPTKSSQRWIDDGNNMVKEFEALGFRDRVGTQLLVNLFYSYIDEEPIAGENHYRVMQVGADNSYRYSPVVKVTTPASSRAVGSSANAELEISK